ncbi:CBO0543 family protein [Bacillus haimaensis]|uniref:CBO0543 family protein n=1 Tax=Bacillus haimaensis TaxID=3160967 RepID=UPI003AA92B03
MTKNQIDIISRLNTQQKEVSKGWIEYWQEYSFFDTWQFWINLLFLVLPLIILWFKMDRSKAFHLGFYGFAVHIIFTYFDTALVRYGLLTYPYQAIPLVPVNFGLDVSLIPVIFMLLYQWTMKYKKNYYLYSLMLSAFLAFVFKPILLFLDLIIWHKWVNPFYLFLFYIVIFCLAKWLTNLFLSFERQNVDKKGWDKTKKR